MSFLYVNLEGMNQEQDLAIATQRPSEGGGERIPKPFDQLPRLAAETTADNPWPVSVLSQKFHTAVERWPAAWIAGQITEINTRRAGSAYLTVRDDVEDIAISVSGWRAFASKAASFKQGDRVVVHGKADIWVKQTRLSFIGDDIRKIGSGGGLKEQIDQLRMKLKGEGLFDADRKLPLPEFPSCIGLICAPHARAEGDVITNVRLRWPTVRFNIVHAFVQGPQCPQSIVEAIHRLDADPDVDVIINGGPVDTAFTGGDVWANPKLVETLRAWVRDGGALVGVGEPSSLPRFQAGRFFQLADVLGVDEERFQTLSVDKYFPPVTPEHFITTDVPVDPAARGAWERAGYRAPLSGCGGGQGIAPLGGIDFGEAVANTYPVSEDVTLLRADNGQGQLAANEYGKGRGVYVSGLPYSAANARLLERALFWASHNEGKYAAYSSSNPECEVAVFDKSGCYCVVNNTDRAQSTYVERGDGRIERIELAPSGIAWRTI